MSDLPSNVGYGTVVGKFLVASPDSADAGFNPDAVAATGTVTFTAAPLRLIDAGAVPPVTIFPTPTVCTLNSSGVLAATEGGTGVTLLATEDPDLSPVGWTYTVTVAITGHPAYEFDMSLPVGATVDLATVTPVDPSGGEVAPPSFGGSKSTHGTVMSSYLAGAIHLANSDGVAPGGAIGTNAGVHAANSIHYVPVVFAHNATVTDLGIYVGGASGGLSTRLGIYENDPSSGADLPGDLLTDYGTASTGSSGPLFATSSQAVTAGELYWAALGVNVAWSGGGAWWYVPWGWKPSRVSGLAGVIYKQAHTFGALPATATAAADSGYTPPLILFKATS